MRLYCTLFDRNYITRGLTLHGSLLRHCQPFELLILCLDEITMGILRALELPHVRLVALSSLEKADPELLAAKFERNAVEYYFTCKPVLMRFALSQYRGAEWITYLDSDLFYFSDPSSLEEEYANGAVALTPHRFPQRLAERRRYGLFNAGWVSARPTGQGGQFIDWWRAQCIEWCRLEVEQHRFADQKYLDLAKDLFPDVVILNNWGANLGPWNLDGLEVRRSENGLLVGGVPLVFFHFHGTRTVFGKFYDSGLDDYGVDLSAQIREQIFWPYVHALGQAETLVRQVPAQDVKAGSHISLRELLRRLKRTAGLITSGTWVIEP